MENTNKIIIRSVYKITRMHVEPSTDPKTGRYPSVVRRVDRNGDRILSEADKQNSEYLIGENEAIELYDGKEFDLNDPYDAAWWEAIKHCPRIAKERWAKNAKGVLVIDGDTSRYGSAEFFVETPGAETKAKNNKNRAVHEAKSFVYGDSPEGLYTKAKLLGSPMNGLPFSDVEDYLIAIADKNPDKIKELYTGTDTHVRMLLIDAIDKRVIIYRDKLYIYGEDIILGATQDYVVHWLKDPSNARLKEGITRETYPELYQVEETQAELAAQGEAQKAAAKKTATK